MKTIDLLNLIVLGAIWGISFMFIRVAAPEFGAVGLMAVRVILASLVLVPLLFARRAMPEVIRHWKPIALMGVLHYAIPFCLFAYSMLTITGGLSAIINASSPLFASAIAWMWPAAPPSPAAWGMAVLLGVLCTAIAFLLYFRLIANIGPTRAITVTFLVPVFAVLFGALFIGEELTGSMFVGGAIILFGTALSTGLLRARD